MLRNLNQIANHLLKAIVPLLKAAARYPATTLNVIELIAAVADLSII
jgi:hypothetical protein